MKNRQIFQHPPFALTPSSYNVYSFMYRAIAPPGGPGHYLVYWLPFLRTAVRVGIRPPSPAVLFKSVLRAGARRSFQ